MRGLRHRITTLPTDFKNKIAPIIKVFRDDDESASVLKNVIPGYDHGVSAEVDNATMDKINKAFINWVKRVYEGI